MAMCRNTSHCEWVGDACFTCGATRDAKRAEQNRRAQKKFRDKRKAEREETDSLRDRIKELELELAACRLAHSKTGSLHELFEIASPKQIISLTHPDKHDGSDLATEVTKYFTRQL